MADDLTEEELDLLHRAFDWARDGETARLTEFFDIGGPVNLTNSKGDTLLILATYHTHLDAVKVLLTRGADVERVNDAGQTALAAAVFRRSTGLVALLLDAGADPDGGPKSARTVAAFFDLPDMTALLPAPKIAKDGSASTPAGAPAADQPEDRHDDDQPEQRVHSEAESGRDDDDDDGDQNVHEHGTAHAPRLEGEPRSSKN